MVSDGPATSAPATVAISVTASNDAPVAADVTIAAGRGVLVQIALGASDVDDPVSSLSYEIVAQPKKGTLTQTSTAGVYTYVASANKGNDSFTFRVRDASGAVSNTARVTIVINCRMCGRRH